MHGNDFKRLYLQKSDFEISSKLILNTLPFYCIYDTITLLGAVEVCHLNDSLSKADCMTLDYLRKPGLVLAEKLITYAVRKKNGETLAFVPSPSLALAPRLNSLPIGLYLHIPFCEELCPYCSFNRVEFDRVLAQRYFEALRKEIQMYRDLGYDFSTVYVGGGTPTILIEELAKTIELVRSMYQVTEISIETSPAHLIAKNIALLKQMGVNRLSVGVQTFNDNLLKLLKRYHKYGSGEEIAERLKHVQGIFQTLNIDMIFNLPTQTLAMLEQDLETILRLNLDQITYYPLMSSSSNQQLLSKNFGVCIDQGRLRSFYDTVIMMLAQHYQASTAWCFSKHRTAIDEYAVHHDEYAGLGSGAIGHIGNSAYANTFDIETYIQQVLKGVLPLAAKKDFSVRERLCYDFLLELFCLHLDVNSLQAKHGVNIYTHLWPELLFFWLFNGLRKRGNSISLTKTGRYYWFLMMKEFFTSVNNFRDYCRAQIAGSRDPG